MIIKLRGAREINLKISGTKKPFSTSKHVIDYLGRFSHRAVITDSRVLTSDEEYVLFKWKDNTDGGKNKMMRLKGTEFIRRFTGHILPPHFRKIRHDGFISNASKAKSIAQARIALGLKIGQLLTKTERKALAIFRLFGTHNLDICTRCKVGKMNAIFGINKNKPPPTELLQKIKVHNSK